VEPEARQDAENLASLSDWKTARDRVVKRVGCEEAESQARTDLTIEVEGLFVVLENKLDAPWHNGVGDPQAVLYRRIGMKRRGPEQRLGLVLLTKREGFDLEGHVDFIKVTYLDVARGLRRVLRSELEGIGPISPAQAFALGPAMLTVVAIEQELLGLDIQRLRTVARGDQLWKWLGPLAELSGYLRQDGR
jgi:hypothetical protein